MHKSGDKRKAGRLRKKSLRKYLKNQVLHWKKKRKLKDEDTLNRLEKKHIIWSQCLRRFETGEKIFHVIRDL